MPSVNIDLPRPGLFLSVIMEFLESGFWDLCQHIFQITTPPRVLLTKSEGPHPKKIVQKSRNSCLVNSGGWEHADSLLEAQMGSVLKPIQTLKEYF